MLHCLIDLAHVASFLAVLIHRIIVRKVEAMLLNRFAVRRNILATRVNGCTRKLDFSCKMTRKKSFTKTVYSFKIPFFVLKFKNLLVYQFLGLQRNNYLLLDDDEVDNESNFLHILQVFGHADNVKSF